MADEFNQFGPKWYSGGGGDPRAGAVPGPEGYYKPEDYDPANMPGALKRIADMSFGRLEKKAREGVKKPYEGERIAEFSSEQKGAKNKYLDRIKDREASPHSKKMKENISSLQERSALKTMEPHLQKATESITAGHRNPFVESYSENVIRPLREEMTENLLENILPQINAGRIAAGNFHGGMRGTLQARALRDLNKVLGREASRGRHEALIFGQTAAERQKERELHGAQLVGNVGGKDLESQLGASKAMGEALQGEQLRDLAELEAHHGIGSKEQQLAQQKLDKDYADYLEQQEGILPELERTNAIIRGMQVPQTTAYFKARVPETHLSSQLGGAGLIAAMNMGKPAAHGGRMRYAQGGAAFVQSDPSIGMIDSRGTPTPSYGETYYDRDPRYQAIVNKYSNVMRKNSYTPDQFQEAVRDHPVWKAMEVGDKISGAVGGNNAYDFASGMMKLIGAGSGVIRSQRQNDRVNSASDTRRDEINNLIKVLNNENAVKMKSEAAKQAQVDSLSHARDRDWKEIQDRDMREITNPTDAYSTLDPNSRKHIDEIRARMQAGSAQAAAARAARQQSSTVPPVVSSPIAPSPMMRPKFASGGAASSLDMWKDRLNKLRLGGGDAGSVVQENMVDDMLDQEQPQDMDAIPQQMPPPAIPQGPVEQGASSAMTALDKMNQHRSKMESEADAYSSGAHDRHPLKSLIEGIGAGVAGGSGTFSERFGKGIEMGLQGIKETRSANLDNKKISMAIRKNLLDTYQKEHEDELKKQSAIEVAKIKGRRDSDKASETHRHNKEMEGAAWLRAGKIGESKDNTVSVPIEIPSSNPDKPEDHIEEIEVQPLTKERKERLKALKSSWDANEEALNISESMMRDVDDLGYTGLGGTKLNSSVATLGGLYGKTSKHGNFFKKSESLATAKAAALRGIRPNIFLEKQIRRTKPEESDTPETIKENMQEHVDLFRRNNIEIIAERKMLSGGVPDDIMDDAVVAWRKENKPSEDGKLTELKGSPLDYLPKAWKVRLGIPDMLIEEKGKEKEKKKIGQAFPSKSAHSPPTKEEIYAEAQRRGLVA